MGYIDSSISSLKGVGKARAEKLSKLGINTLKDLVYLFPRAYERRGDVKPLCAANTEAPCSMMLTVGSSVKTAKIRNGLTISKFSAFDDTGSVEVIFFNSPFVKDVFHVGSEFRFWGKITRSGKKLQLQSPKYEPYVEGVPLADIVPIYPQTQGISSKIISNLTASVIDGAVTSITDPLPDKIRHAYSLPTLGYALKNVHFPENEEALSRSLSRLAFDEMLLFGLGISIATHHKKAATGVSFSPCSMKPICDLLPYELTNDQKNAVNDIYKDTVARTKDQKISPMARIIVGDVGCGKTVCAIMAMYLCVKSGFQTALMVPTEILARQHYAEISDMFLKLGIDVALLTGHTRQSEKKKIYEKLTSGDLKVVIGTHALISDKVSFENLGLIVTDEQHRFGVGQRTVLKEKTKRAHMLVMSATPIPRTLALTMYGDLDISGIKEMPKGRMRVDTFVVGESYRSRLNAFIEKQISLGGQCYIVCPAIEAKDNDEKGDELHTISSPFSKSSDVRLKNAVEYTDSIKKSFPSLRIECLHGKMKSQDKDEIMSRFVNGEVDILVSTTVIEVGINVPNASLMVIENAERFGLSQLHQLRGRVGRGQKKSYCVLVSDSESEASLARLSTMRDIYDGFEIAERDLELRGPGDFFSSDSGDNIRQSGGFEFKFSRLCDDISLVSKAFSEAKAIIQNDPELSSSDNILLKKMLSDALFRSSLTIS